MKNSKTFWRTLLCLTLLAALCGNFAFPVVGVSAAKMQATACLGTTITQWTFQGDVVTPAVGAGTYIVGSGLPGTSFAVGNPDSAVTYNSWPATLNASAYIELDVPMTGRNSIQFTMDYRATGTGPNALELHYSTDGSSFTLLNSSVTLTRDSLFHSLSFDLSTISALNDNANAKFRLYAYGSTNAGGTLRLDNLTFSGNCIFPADTNTPTATPTATNTPTPTNTPSSTPTRTPTSTPSSTRSVIINEVAWGGTTAAANDEWFELYNTTGSDINLTGWRLVADDGNPDIALSGTITALDPYFVYAKNNLVFNDLVPDKTFTGSLSNTGEILYLLDPSGNQVDSANQDGGPWDGGSGSPTFASMERQGNVADTPSAWVTYAGTTPVAHDRAGNNIKGTPGQGNWISTITPTPTATVTGTSTPTPTRTSTPGICGVGATPTSVIINEVAWAGNSGTLSADEWIELRNPTSMAINLDKWVLKGLDGTPSITLSNFTLPPGGFYLLERGDETTVADVTSNQIFTGEIGNSNEVLQLFNSSGVCVDTANSNGGNWPAGSSSNYGSMERRGVVTDSDSAWITNVQASTWKKHDANNNLIHGTPGYDNWAYSVTPTPSPVPTATLRPTPTRTATPLPPPPLLVINEFVPRPGHDWNNDGVVNVEDEYVEILNHGVIDVNLSGYRLDDEVNIGSNPFDLPGEVLKPGERIVFYGSESGLLLGDGGDGVRLLKPNGQLMDAYNYTVVLHPDQAYCRLPDNGGADDWNQNCFPTPGLQNSLSGTVPAPANGVGGISQCPIADTLPTDFVLAECDPFGNNIWRAEFWDKVGWYEEQYLPEIESKWPVFAD